MFEIIIENIDEEFETIETKDNLEDAIEFAKKYPKEKYKNIFIEHFDKDMNLVKIIEVEIK